MSDTPNTTPTPGFEFPLEAADQIEASLRALHKKDEPVRSVRPERQKPVIPQMADPVVAQPSSIPTEDWRAVAQAAMVKTPVADPTPMSTEDSISLDLPSKFAYYDFKDLYVKPFKATHLAKLAKADAQNSLQLLVEVVSSVITTPQGTKNIGFDLSVPDLNAVMFWLRMNSFTKQTMTVTSRCENPEHNHQVAEKLLPEESLKITTTIQQTDVEVRFLDNMPDPEVFRIVLNDDRLGTVVIPMRPETMRDAIQMLDHKDFADEEFQYKVKVLSVLDFERAFPNIEWTLAKKLSFYDEGLLSLDDILLAQRFSELLESYGVLETVPTKCGKCGASGTALLSFDAQSFLSPNF